MPRETCWSCKQMKGDVTLCADDRWFGDCVRENESKLNEIHSVDHSTTVADHTSLSTSLLTALVDVISGRSTRSATVAIGRTTDDRATINQCYATKSDAHKRSGKSKQNTQKTLPVYTFSSRQLTELNALDGAAIPMTVTAVSEVAKVATPSETENIVPSLGADGADSSGHANELLSFVGFYHKSNVKALCYLFSFQTTFAKRRSCCLQSMQRN